jgi:PAS domain S-box-containing protein
MNYSESNAAKSAEPAADFVELTDLIDIQMLRSLFNDFCALARVPMTILDTRGNVVVSAGWQEICKEFHRANPESCKKCLESDLQFAEGVKAGEYRLYKCKNNMWNITTPLIVDSRHIANLYSGQFFFDGEDVDEELFRAQAQQFGFDEEKYIVELRKVPRLSPKAVNTGMEFLRKFAHLLSQISYNNTMLVRALAERERSQEALSRMEKYVSRVVDSKMVGIFMWNHSDHIDDANDTFLQMLGYTRDELEAGKINLRDITPPENRPRDHAALEKLLTSGSCPPYESVYLRKDTSPISVLVGIALIDEPGRGIAWVLDISHQKALEAQLLQTQKMEAVGQLAGSMAHDFNNLLMAISSHAELLLATTAGNSYVEKEASTILSATGRATELTGKLLALGRRQQLAVTAFDINQLICYTAELVSRLLSREIDFQVACARDACVVWADRAQTEQMMINLILNARDAMPKGGRLIVSVSGVVVGNDDCGLHAAVPTGNYALVTVADTGEGIPASIQHNIFDPFFTTKQERGGTGLGLTMAYRVVTQGGGHIRVKSEVDVGTTISVYLPLQAGQTGRESASIPLRQSGTTESPCSIPRTVLVVDDEDLVRSSVRAFLEQQKVTVVDTGDPSEALSIAEKLGDELSILITDVIMPGMSGPELAHALLAKYPRLPIVFISGYAVADRSQELFPTARFLQKPFTRQMLIDCMRASQ